MMKNLLQQSKVMASYGLAGIFLQCLFLNLAIAFSGNAQEPESIRDINVRISGNQLTLTEVFSRIEAQTSFEFSYDAAFIDQSERISIHASNTSLLAVLRQIASDKKMNFRRVDNTIFIKKSEVKGEVEEVAQVMINVQGTVTASADGTSLPGVNVLVQGTNIGTVTDIDGQYSINVPNENDTLAFSSIGYLSKMIPVQGQSQINVALLDDVQSLEEVVVVGYGTVKKSDLTGSVSTIKPKELLDRPTVNTGQALTGKLPGVEVFNNSGRPDGKVRIRIRGNNSINASNEPLYVIDGVIGVADINLLNPNNIESLEVLKDASATAIYGARGANGVVLITTKRGVKSEKGIISYDSYTSFGVVAPHKNLQFLNASEWWQVYNTGFDNIAKYDPDGFAQGKFQRVLPEDLPQLFDESGNPIYDTDWEDETFRTAVSQNHQLSFRGGNDKTVYSAYVNYLHQEALMDKNYLDRYNGQLNVDSDLRDWLKLGVNISVNYNTGNDLYGNYQLKRLAQEALPFIPVRYPNGNWGSNRDFPGGVQDTPARYLEEMVNQVTNTQIISNMYLDFSITDDLSFKTTFAVDNKSAKTNYYVGKNLIQFGGKNNSGVAQISTESQLYWQNENYFNYDKQLGSGNLNLMVGLSWQQRSAQLLGTEHRNFIDDFYQWHNLGAGTVNLPSSSSDWQWSLNSYFARANYSLLDKYLFTATGRFDGSSKFGRNNQYAFFPSLAFAWRVSEENFLKDNSLIDNLKFRASVGKTGNQEIDNYAYSQTLGLTNVIFADEFYAGLYRSSFGNPDLRWETTSQVDAGIDVGLWKSRVSLSADFYHKVTDDLLLNAPIPYTSGLNSVMQNVGAVRNQGFELALTSYNITRNDFNWTSRIAFASNQNRIIRLGANDEDIFPTIHATGNMQILRVGEPVGSFWGLTRLGVWGTDEEEEAQQYNRLPGDLKYADLNEDGRIDANDNSIIGKSFPDWTMGFSNTLTYRNLELSIDFRVVQGLDVMNAATHNREDRSGVANGSRTLLNAWTPENQNTMIAELRYMKTYYDSYPDTHWLQDGSFVRLQNVLLGYTFESALLEKWGLQRLRIYGSGQNLLLFTKYKGYDPEVSTYDGVFGQGIDDFGEPRARTYTIGLNVSF
ncbi:MAG: TonB-dependent receptor [Cyclobacteriaceae bacterium]